MRLCRAVTQSEYTVYGAQWPVSGSWCQCYPLARPPGGYSPNSAQPGAPRKSLRYPPDRTTLADLFFQQTNLFPSSSILLPLFPSSSILFSLFCSVVLYIQTQGHDYGAYIFARTSVLTNQTSEDCDACSDKNLCTYLILSTYRVR